MKKIISKRIYSLSFILIVAVVSFGIVYAASSTIIGTNVSTADLTISGNATTTGQLRVIGDISLGTVASGTWSGTAIALTKGGTGATTDSGARTSLGLTDTGIYASSTWLKTANNLSDLNNVVTAWTNLGLGSIALLPNTGSTTITTLGTIATGVWNGTAILDAKIASSTDYLADTNWNGGSTGLVAATGRTSLELGSMALLANTGSTTITTLGTIATGVWNGSTIGVIKGGTGLATIAANKILYTSAENTLTATDITDFGRGLIDDADMATARTTLGLGSMALEANTGSTTITTLGTIGTLGVSGTSTLATTTISGTLGVSGTSNLGAIVATTLGASDSASLGTTTIGTGGTAISKYISITTTTLTSASIAATSCADYADVTVTGAATGDTVIASPTAITGGIETVGLIWNAYASLTFPTDHVIIRACNPTNAAIDTANTQTWRISVLKH